MRKFEIGQLVRKNAFRVTEDLPEGFVTKVTGYDEDCMVVTDEAGDERFRPENEFDAVDAPEAQAHDAVDHPVHYTAHPSGIECIQITEHMNFNLGNATKYIWRADLKHDAIEDLKKARWYLDREISRREAAA